MTTLAVAVLSILLSFEPNATDTETQEEREVRLATTAQAISDTASRQTWVHPNNSAAIQISLAWFETRFGQKDHEGHCSRKDGCDKGLSRTMWQLWQGSWIPDKDKMDMIGTSLPATALASSWASTIFQKAYNYCKSYEGAYALYATGNKCEWEGAGPRFRLHRQLESRITQILKRPYRPVKLSEGFFGAHTLKDGFLEQGVVPFDSLAFDADDSVSVGVMFGPKGHHDQVLIGATQPAVTRFPFHKVSRVSGVTFLTSH